MAQPGDLIERAILEICRDVCELPDRSSPEGEPDQVIVTLEELSDICRNVLTEALSAIPMMGEVERDTAVRAWSAGARAVHDEWAKADEGERFYLSRDHEPDFTEAAYDYAAALTDHTTKDDE